MHTYRFEKRSRRRRTLAFLLALLLHLLFFAILLYGADLQEMAVHWMQGSPAEGVTGSGRALP